MGMTLPLNLRQSVRTNMAPAPRSSLEQKFLDLWRLHRGPELKEQFRFHPTRKYRADFYHEGTRTILELDGGLFKGMGHQRGAAYERDRMRDIEAMLDGYRVFRLVPRMVCGDWLTRIIADIDKREAK